MPTFGWQSAIVLGEKSQHSEAFSVSGSRLGAEAG